MYLALRRRVRGNRPAAWGLSDEVLEDRADRRDFDDYDDDLADEDLLLEEELREAEERFDEERSIAFGYEDVPRSLWDYRDARLYKVRLGRTRFSEVAGRNGVPRLVKGAYWPRGFSYSEVHYFGNPGYYQHFAFIASTIASWAPVGAMSGFTDHVGAFEWPSEDPSAPPLPRPTLEALRRFRGHTAVTTFTVVGNLLLDE